LSLRKQGTISGIWIPRIKCGAGSAGVYPVEKRGRNDKKQKGSEMKVKKLKNSINGQ